ncbi:unnamed protein product [Peronospora belbahrii]|uniref:Uncharacterized protein n=1 Tax=Peronospora belbahrii TaxID=622444 RepID=A0AAU9KQA4_9STRA|nr:unnamed protein product [Peronospora belbahrii]
MINARALETMNNGDEKAKELWKWRRIALYQALSPLVATDRSSSSAVPPSGDGSLFIKRCPPIGDGSLFIKRCPPSGHGSLFIKCCYPSGVILAALGGLDTAIKVFEDAVVRFLKNANMHYNLANMHIASDGSTDDDMFD